MSTTTITARLLPTPLAAALLGAMLVPAACTTVDPATGERVANRTGTGILIGAVTGAAAGTAAGGDDRRNAALGATVGAITGAAVGQYMDRQERALREAARGTAVVVERTGEDTIRVVMPADVTFDTDSAAVKPVFRSTLSDLARTLAAAPATTVDVVGHADARGPDAYNLALSQRRAEAVTGLLAAGGVAPARMAAIGRGEAEPVAPNTTAEGLARNRRVEIRLRAITQG